MKKNKIKEGVVSEQEKIRGLEIVKAVAQAWYSHSEGSRLATNNNNNNDEFEARRRNDFRGNKPTRFKVEAIITRNKNRSCSTNYHNNNNNYNYRAWDFGQSLWDSYEIVTVSKRLETGLVLDSSFSEIISDHHHHHGTRSHHRRRKESKHSLRSLFTQMSSKRFNESKISRE